MNNLKKDFEELHEELNLSHHKLKRSLAYLVWCFKGVDFKNKTVLDIGGGNGIYSFYARSQGAHSAINLEPFGAGSTEINIFSEKSKNSLFIEFDNRTIQEYDESQKFDIIILHDSINHLNEELFIKIDKDSKALIEYHKIISKISNLLNNKGQVIVTDCARNNFWPKLGLKNPFAPSIDWHLHQSPKMIVSLFKETDSNYSFSLRWSPFKRFDGLGRILSLFGFLPSFFMQSHYNLIFIKNKNQGITDYNN